MNESHAPAAGIVVPERFIPTPTSVSPEAQAFLSAGFAVTPPEIAMEDKEGWRNYVASVDRYMAEAGTARYAAFPAAISEHRLSATTLYEVVPESLSPDHGDKAIYHIHGGAFIVGGGISAAHTAQPVASVARLRSFSVDYRMPPTSLSPTGSRMRSKAIAFCSTVMRRRIS